MLTLLAPAKLNLTLEVLSRRPDGFHEIRSVMQTISLGDSLSFRLSQGIEVKCDKPDWSFEDSLVSRAIGLIRQETGCSKGVKVEIIKRIPLASGLGGDSSDGVAILLGLDRLWGLGLSQERLVDLAAKLGSDVPFFLYSGTALAEGRGEVLTPLPQFSQMKVVLMVPPLPQLERKTERLYRNIRESHYTGGKITGRLVAVLKRGQDVSSALLFNVFEQVAFDNFDGLEEYWRRFLEAGAEDVHLAGSGPALFTLIKDRLQAEAIYQRLQDEGLESYLASTMLKGSIN